jgi:hypothetical protein
VESANYGFALLAHELEILDGVIVGVASATKALKLNESEVRSCVVQLESIQSTMVILQARSPLSRSLSLSLSALQVNSRTHAPLKFIRGFRYPKQTLPYAD